MGYIYLQVWVPAEVKIPAVIAARADYISQHKGHTRLLQGTAQSCTIPQPSRCSSKTLKVATKKHHDVAMVI